MSAVRVEYQLEIRRRSATVTFLRDFHRRWMADVSIEGVDGQTHLNRDVVGPTRPCESEAERLFWFAFGRNNSGRAG